MAAQNPSDHGAAARADEAPGDAGGEPAPSGRASDRWTRLAILVQVALIVALAAAVAVLATWLGARPAFRARVDLTATRRNTLDPVLWNILRGLPEPVTVETFFRAVREPLRQPVYQAQENLRELLRVARSQAPDKLEVIEHDLSDLSASAQRLAELEIQEDNVVAVVCGAQKVVLRLFRDIAQFDPGNPAERTPARMVSFRGDEALGEALLDVSLGRRPKVLFVTGHGEGDLNATHPGGLASLRTLLSADGFEVGTWSFAQSPTVPADCDVLVWVDPAQPAAGEELDVLRAWVAAGGRLFAVPSHLEDLLDRGGSVGELLREFGIVVQPGFAAQLQRNQLGNYVDGDPACAVLFLAPERLNARHPVTEPLARLGWPLQNVPLARWFARGALPEGATLDALAETPVDSWNDRPDAAGRFDWRYDSSRERSGPLAIAMAWDRPLRGASSALPEDSGDRHDQNGAGEPQPRTRARIVAFGSSGALGNEALRSTRDFVLNAFNWLAARDWRLNVRPRDPDRRVLDLVNGNALARANRISLFGLPGLFALCGTILAWRRRK